MAHMKSASASLPATATPSRIALASFANMFSVGSVYALSMLHAELPRLLGTPRPLSFAPFGAACLGLSVGVSTCASLMTRSSARVSTASGTALWGFAVVGAGHFLARSSLQGIFACLFLGGIGVGWTYLGVVILIGQGFPNQPLARSAIGPFGFSSGTAACFSLGSLYEFSSLDAEKLGHCLKSGGIVFIVIAAVTIALLPIDADHSKLFIRPQNTRENSTSFFSILLFFNALPGMTAISGLLPVASYYSLGPHDKPTTVLPYTMAALTFGGFLAPALSSRFGAELLFIILFYFRGLVLITLSQFPEPAAAMVALVIVLFGHGTGFSVLPGLIKNQQAEPTEFPYAYGQILTTWGIAGVIGTAFMAVFASALEEVMMVSLLVGLLVLSFGAALYWRCLSGGTCFRHINSK